MKAKRVNEGLDFERGQDPKRAMDLGIFYKKWREDHDQKPLVIYRFFLSDPMGNKKIYTVTLMYKSKNGNHIGDTVYFTNERLLSPSGTMFSLSNMQTKPDHVFDAAETTFWDKPETFNKEIDQMVKSPKGWFNDMCEEWFEQPFETMMKSWFRSGIMRVEKAEFQFKG